MGNFFNPSGAALTSDKDDWETPFPSAIVVFGKEVKL